MQKAIVEQSILALGERGTVIRLPKVVSSKVPLFAHWLSSLSRGQVIKPFSDLSLSPISLSFLTKALAQQHLTGIVHLSGAKQVTYEEFALLLAKALGVPTSLVEPTTAKELNVPLLFAPRYTTLDTSDTTAIFGIEPQTIWDVVSDLVLEYSESLANTQSLPSAT